VIPVQLQPEPSDFNQKVRIKGLAFLKQEPHPKVWKNRDYWTAAINDLCRAYNRICAYSAQWIPPAQGTPTIDHFIPKSVAPNQAYEWKNYRLSCQLLNSRKWTFQDVLDPFIIQPGWFVLDFPSLHIKPGSSLDDHIRQKVINTINRLKLNDEDSCIQSRESWLFPFCQGQYPFSFLKGKAPFIAYELERQNLVDKISSMYPMELDKFLEFLD